MIIRQLLALGILATLVACSRYETRIAVLCEKGQKGNYALKWEIFPEQDDAIVEIFASSNDSIFPQIPIMRVAANKFIAAIDNADSLDYNFFKLKIGKTYSSIVTNRLLRLDSVHNFRDIGGYKTNDGKLVRWRKIFRSGELNSLTPSDDAIIRKLDIRSVIDLRSYESQQSRKDKLTLANRLELYIAGISNDSISKQVLDDRFFRGDAIIHLQDIYEKILLSHTEEYARFFEFLLDEKNYPIVYHCSLGKDQSGIATYFLLRALAVPEEVAEDDYMLSNIGVNKSKILNMAILGDLTESQQEAFTILTRTDDSYLRYGLACAKKEDGSIDAFMETKLRLTADKRKRLREILLY